MGVFLRFTSRRYIQQGYTCNRDTLCERADMSGREVAVWRINQLHDCVLWNVLWTNARVATFTQWHTKRQRMFKKYCIGRIYTRAMLWMRLDSLHAAAVVSIFFSLSLVNGSVPFPTIIIISHMPVHVVAVLVCLFFFLLEEAGAHARPTLFVPFVLLLPPPPLLLFMFT